MLDGILQNPYAAQNSFKVNLIGAEARYIASRLRSTSYQKYDGMKSSSEPMLHPISNQGPIDLALEAFKLVVLNEKYYGEDIRIASRQCTSLIYQEPKLSSLMVRIMNQLYYLFKHISTPRVLKAYIKAWYLYEIICTCGEGEGGGKR